MQLSVFFDRATSAVHRAAMFLAFLLSGTNKSVHDLEASHPLVAAAVQIAETEMPGLTLVAQDVLSAAQQIATATAAAVPAAASAAVMAAAATADTGAVKLGGLRSALGMFLALALGAGTLIGCTIGTASTVATTVATDATAAADATPDVVSLVATIQAIVAGGTVTPAEQATVTTELDQLSAIATTVTPASTGSTIATALGGIENVISTLAPIFGDLLPLIALVDNVPDALADFAALVETVAQVAPATVQHSNPAMVAAVAQHLKHLKAIAAAKLAAGK